jgi:putative DNA primase/helicase
MLPPPAAPFDVVKVFLAEKHAYDDTLTLRYWRGGFWRWVGPRWVELDKDHVRKLLYEFTDSALYIKRTNDGDKHMPWLPNDRRISALVDAMKAACETPADIDAPVWLDGRKTGTIVACGNGLLQLDGRKLIPHTPHFFNLQALPFNYDSAAASPIWDGFMRELWGEDDEPPKALEEMMGAAVAGKLDLHRILVLVGPPRGGKSLIASTFEALVGPMNTSWVSLTGLTDDRTLSSLIGKSLVINSDIRATRRRGPEIAEVLLRISGQDSFTIDRKYKEAWTGPLHVLVVQISNELPTIRDASGALASRYLPLILTQSWLGREDPTLKERLMAELPGILNRALAGLDAIEANGRFTVPKASQEVAEELVEMASPMMRFVQERLTVMPEAGNRDDYMVETGELLRAYNDWAMSNHEEQINRSRLGQRLRAVLPQVQRAQPRHAVRGRIVAYSGIRLEAKESDQQRAVHGALSEVMQRTKQNIRVIEGDGDCDGQA